MEKSQVKDSVLLKKRAKEFFFVVIEGC